MEVHPELAAALLLIACAAQRFAEAYHDEPLSVTAADDELEQFSSLVRVLSTAYDGPGETPKLSALNRAATISLRIEELRGRGSLDAGNGR